MRFRKTGTATGLAFLLAHLLVTVPHASAQSAIAVPQLDPNRLIGTYYEIARYPIRREKQCISKEMVLYALGDKQNSLQVVTACQLKQDFSTYWNSQGKFSKSADGRISLSAFWPFTTKYWVLGIAPDYSWALVGNPNHKSLWILSHTATLPAEVLAGIKATAAAQGFDTSKLIRISQEPSAEPGVPKKP